MNRHADGGHVPALDGMRGVAVAAVMITHAVYGRSYLQGGSIGVDVFFVLSGFLITYLLVREYDRKGQRLSFRKFYARRALRLGPALILLLLTFSLGSCVFLDAESAQSNLIDALITLFYAANWARAFDIHPPHLLGHAWSLSAEEQFYVLWPIILLAMLRTIRSRAHIVYLVCAGAALSWLLRVWLMLDGATVGRVYNGLDTRADSLLIGCAVGILLASDLIGSDTRQAVAKKLRIVAPLSAIVFASVLFFGNWRSAHLYYWLLAVVEIMVAAIILQIFVAERSALKWFLSLRPLVWVGTISYGLYLWHYPIYSLLHGHGLTHKGIIAGTIATFVIASVSYYGLEKPLLRLKDRFTMVRTPLISDRHAFP
ncbi:MAG: acyltransferase family protein [Gammaproteobacteria bacterium]